MKPQAAIQVPDLITNVSQKSSGHYSIRIALLVVAMKSRVLAYL